jgi:hypothetical protein
LCNLYPRNIEQWVLSVWDLLQNAKVEYRIAREQ